jgi:hypothetical protein
MAEETWKRRDLIQRLAALTLAWAVPLGALRTPRAAGAEPPMPRDPEARRRWALARMDDVARERLRCHERFKEPRQIRTCQEEFERRHRAYNEIYIDAARQ